LVIPASGAYSANGLYVSQPDAPCSPNKLSADEDPTDLTGFETAGWSPDGSTVAASFEIAEPPAGNILLFRNGEKRVLLDHLLSYWPLYSKDGRYIYYIQRTARLYYPGSESIWRYDMQLGESHKVAAVPEGWSLWLHGWTGEEYLVLRAQSSNAAYWSTDNRVVLLDPETGGVVYASAASDFTAYAGFVPP
jgi:Tol biopolymer transport system component